MENPAYGCTLRASAHTHIYTRSHTRARTHTHTLQALGIHYVFEGLSPKLLSEIVDVMKPVAVGFLPQIRKTCSCFIPKELLGANIMRILGVFNHIDTLVHSQKR